MDYFHYFLLFCVTTYRASLASCSDMLVLVSARLHSTTAHQILCSVNCHAIIAAMKLNSTSWTTSLSPNSKKETQMHTHTTSHNLVTLVTSSYI